jgi:hypothetical protein
VKIDEHAARLIAEGHVVSAQETYGGSKLDGDQPRISSYFERFGIHTALIPVLCTYYILNAPQILGHYDLGWHLAAGDLIRERGNVPFQDPWSFTLGDRQWFNASWLWDVIASVVFQYTQFSGLVVFVVACGAIIAGYLASICLNAGASAIAVCIAVFSAGLLFPSYATFPNVYLAAAPNMATMLFCVVFYRQCLKKAGCLWLPLIMLLWVNLHGGFVMGFVIVGVFCGVALLRADWPSFKTYSIVGVGCFIAIFINPLGWQIYYGVVTTMGHFVQAYITEWLSFYENITMPGSIPCIAYILLFVALELRFRNSTPVPLEARLLSWLFLFLGIYQFRYMSLFILFSTIVVALHVDRLLSSRSNNFDIRKLLLSAAVIGVCALPIAFMQVQPAIGLPQMLSQKDASYLRTRFSHARVLNHWNVGGLLIFYTRGAVPVFVDGRAATAYPDDLLRDYFKLVELEINETAWDEVLAKYRIDAVLWVKAHEQLRRFLVEKRGWKEEYAGMYQSVYVKP